MERARNTSGLFHVGRTATHEVSNQTQSHWPHLEATLTPPPACKTLTKLLLLTTLYFPPPEGAVWMVQLVLAQTVQRQDRKCAPSLTPRRTSLQIRIVGGRSNYEGRVEVQVGSKWGTVCSAGWTTREAMVVCRQLGLGYSMHAITVSTVGPKSSMKRFVPQWHADQTYHSQVKTLNVHYIVLSLTSHYNSQTLDENERI